MNSVKAIFAGGGTGGHLFPAITIADFLKKRVEPKGKMEILFVGTRRGIEYRMRGELVYPLELINIRGLRRSLSLSNLLFPLLLIGSILKSLLIVSRFKPHIVIGTGGYVMAPVILAAVILGVPRVIQEQNSYPGLATRKLGPMVNRLFLGFGEAARFFKKSCNLTETGNPVKDTIGKALRQEGIDFFQLDNNKKTIFILGGSLGALKINRNIMSNLNQLPYDCQLIWQTGEGDYKEVAASAGGRVTGRALIPFISRMDLAYAAADLIIARAGAVTLAEIEVAGLPAILIPYPYAAGDHQMLNARAFAEKGGAIIIENDRLDSVSLLDEAVGLFKSGKISEMSQASAARKNFRTKAAADAIVDEILELINYDKE